MIWLITANTNSCRIFEYDKKEKELTLINELSHMESKLKDMDLVSDKPGHYKTSSSTRGAYESRLDPKEVEIHNFAHEISKALELGKNTNQFQNLILVMPPHMNGLVNLKLDDKLKKIVLYNIIKDYTHLREDEILDALKRDTENKKIV